MPHVLTATTNLPSGATRVTSSCPTQCRKPIVDAVVDVIWDFMDMDRDDPDSWYSAPQGEFGMVELSRSGMVELYQHQALWDNRQHPRVYGAFVDIWQTEQLWVTIDRVNLNPPARPDWEAFRASSIGISTHRCARCPSACKACWPWSTYEAGEGGLQVVPGFHRLFDDWVKTQPADRDPWKPDISGYDLVGVEMQAGDLVIWNSQLPHGTSRNNSDRPRLAQYISMFPAPDDDPLRQERVASWRDRTPRVGPAFPGDPRRWEIEQGVTAELTPLGEKLLGLRSW